MDDLELRATALEIRILAAQLAKLADRDLDVRLASVGSDLTGTQYEVLRLLSNGPLTLTAISRRMILTPTTLVPIIDTLEGKGLLARGRDPNDRRSRPLALTESGTKTLAELSPIGSPALVYNALTAMGA